MLRNPYILLLLATLFWGANSSAGKLAVGHISPMMLNTLRWAIAAAIMLAIALPHLRRDWPVLRENFALLFALGATGFSLFSIALYSALHYTNAINVSIEQAGVPMVIFAISFMLFRTPVTWAQIAGFLMSLAGIALTASHGNLAGLARLEVNFGDLLMLFAVLLYAGYTVALRYKPKLHWTSLMTALCVAALVTSLPFTAWEASAGEVLLPDLRGWATVAFIAVFPSIVSQIFYIRGVELIGANRAGVFLNMIPIFGMLLAVLLLGESFHFYHVVAIALVLGGIWLAERGGRKREAP